MSTKSGGLAFPAGAYDTSGMTLRDYFAAHALNQLSSYSGNNENIARHCYGIADAMLAERAKGGGA